MKDRMKVTDARELIEDARTRLQELLDAAGCIDDALQDSVSELDDLEADGEEVADMIVTIDNFRIEEDLRGVEGALLDIVETFGVSLGGK